MCPRPVALPFSTQAAAPPRRTIAPARRLAGAVALVLALAWSVPASPALPAAPARRCLVVSIDGLRPDVLLRARIPNLRGLLDRGSFTMWARTVPAAVTLPSHVSLLTGVSPARHGIEWNGDPPPSGPLHPASPTLFEVAHAAGLSTAMVAGKAKFVALQKPGSLDWSCVPRGSTLPDSAVTDTAVAWIARHRPRVFFVHLPDTDVVGHAGGWGSTAQIAVVERADRCVGRLLAALRAQGLLDSTVVLVTADHGGTGRTHGADDPRSRYIPWILAGPGVHADLDLTTGSEPDVRIEDGFATVCALLGLEPPQPVEGRVVTGALTDPR